MTHDELLAMMEVNHPDWCNWFAHGRNCPFSAVVAVIKLHKPVLDTFLYGLELDPPEVTQRYECENCGVYYPCPTIQAIMAILNG